MAKFKVGDRVVEDKAVSGVDLVRHWNNTYWKHQEGSLIGEEFFITRVSDYGVSYSNRLNGRGPTIEHKYLKLAPLKIEAGKFYKTRDGRKVGPAFVSGDIATFGYRGNHGSAVWVDSGRHNTTTSLPSDIVAEWIDEPAIANDNTAPTKPKFKVGDRVRCLKDYGTQFTAGKIYVVRADHYGREYESVMVEVDDNGSRKNGWLPEFFELVATTNAIVCLIEKGQPKPSIFPHVHATVEAASKEANRLAGVHKGQEFGVYVLQSTAKVEKPWYEHEWQRLAVAGNKIEAIKQVRAANDFLSLRSAKLFVEDFLERAA